MARLSALLLLAAQTVCGLRVAVSGASGRTGSLLVRKLLSEGHSVTAIIRDEQKAKASLPQHAGLELVVMDLGSAEEQALQAVCEGADRLIWCATGFSDDGELM